MIADPTAPTVAEAIGARVFELRTGHRVTRDALARAGSVYGLTWGRTSIENIEAGRFAPTIPTLYVLCRALSALAPAGQDRIELVDLLPDDGTLEIAAGFAIPVPRLRRFLGDRSALVVMADGVDELMRALTGPTAAPTLTEKRAAHKLGIDVATIRELALDVWMGESLDQVVTASVGPDATSQARGHETRRRVEELRQVLKQRGSDG